LTLRIPCSILSPMVEVGKIASGKDLGWLLQPPTQEGVDFCASPTVDCKYVPFDPQMYPNLTGGNGTVVIESRAPINNGACDAMASMQPGFDTVQCNAMLDLLDSANATFPTSLHITLRGGILEVGGGTEPNAFLAQVNNYAGLAAAAPTATAISDNGTSFSGQEVVPSDPNLGVPIQQPTNADRVGLIGTGVTIAAFALAAGAVWVKSKIDNARRYYGEHPEAGKSKSSKNGTWKRAGTFHHTKDAFEAESDASKAARRSANEVRGLLDEHGVPKRPPPYATWPHSLEHTKEQEAIQGFAQKIQGMPPDRANSLFYFIGKVKGEKYAGVYRDIYRHNEKRGVDGPTTVNSDIDHDFYLQGASDVQSLLQSFEQWINGQKK
jgi:hypothetical protein